MGREYESNAYWMPEGVRACLRGAGYSMRVLEDIEPHIREWDLWMRTLGEYDYRDTDGFGWFYQVHRRSIMPAMRVCREWDSLLLDEKTTIACDSQKCTNWLGSFLSATNFWGIAQETVVRAFGLGTGAFALWLDTRCKAVKVRHYDVRMVVPLPWDTERIRKCVFVTWAFSNGKSIDQLQMHVIDDEGTFIIMTVCFDKDGREASVPVVFPEVETGSSFPTFGILRPAVPNTRVDFSLYGRSVFVDAVDAVQSVDLCYDAMVNEIDAEKMRVFFSDVMFDQAKDASGKRAPIPFDKGAARSFAR